MGAGGVCLELGYLFPQRLILGPEGGETDERVAEIGNRIDHRSCQVLQRGDYAEGSAPDSPAQTPIGDAHVKGHQQERQHQEGDEGWKGAIPGRLRFPHHLRRRTHALCRSDRRRHGRAEEERSVSNSSRHLPDP